jgi:hypothetical protein
MFEISLSAAASVVSAALAGYAAWCAYQARRVAKKHNDEIAYATLMARKRALDVQLDFLKTRGLPTKNEIEGKPYELAKDAPVNR